jgi:hypothetical protein
MSEAAKVHSLEDIHRAISSADERPIYTYKIPPSIARSTGVTSVGLVELTPKEMIAAEGRGTSRSEVAFELVKESWRRIDGRPITTGDGSTDVEWARSGAGWTKLRTLVGQAYNRIHNPEAAENEAFLASEAVSIGR